MGILIHLDRYRAKYATKSAKDQCREARRLKNDRERCRDNQQATKGRLPWSK